MSDGSDDTDDTQEVVEVLPWNWIAHSNTEVLVFSLLLFKDNWDS